VLESIRVDTSETFFGVRTNVWVALAAVVIGILIFVVQSRRHTGKEPSPYLPGRGPRPTSVVDSEDTFSEHDDDAADGVTSDEPVTTTR
jgi:hypothetical protein